MQHNVSAPSVAIVGGGWSGLAAAVHLTQAGHHVSVWEASRTWGGRARALPLSAPDGSRWMADNGQHILIGAYHTCLQLMAAVGVNTTQALRRLPLDLRYADGLGLQLPDLPAPWDALVGIARTRGWSWHEKWALLRVAARWRWQQFQCDATAAVADICHDLPAALLRDFIDPLCLSALNLPAHQASGRLFLRVLQDSLFSGHGGSNLLIPRVDLGQVFPATAAQWLQAHGANLHRGVRVQNLAFNSTGQQWHVNGQPFDHVIIATGASDAARLVRHAADDDGDIDNNASTRAWAHTAQALQHTAIATVYAYSAHAAQARLQLSAPMVALRSDVHAPAQFAFDKSQLGGPAGWLALVVSASTSDKETLQPQVIAQARAQLGWSDLQAMQTVIDKRATFACTPQVQRPGMQIAPRLWACGDYVQGPYPATLEGATRSGAVVAHLIGAHHHSKK